jgi:hypothetical protein
MTQTDYSSYEPYSRQLMDYAEVLTHAANLAGELQFNSQTDHQELALANAKHELMKSVREIRHSAFVTLYPLPEPEEAV